MPEMLYVVIGQPDPQGADVPYPTDPRFYGVDVFNRLMPDDEFEREHRQRVHVYQEVDHAIDAMDRCGLEPVGSFLMVYVRNGDQWTYDDAATAKVIQEVDW